MATDALNILYDIRATTFKNAASLPLKEEVVTQWQGLGFLVGGVRLVAKLGEVVELLQVPRLTTLPAVKPWVKGIANIRGRLVPVIDLHNFLGLTSTQPVSQWRILVVEHQELVAGLIVEQSIGMQHFAEGSFEEGDGQGLDGLQPFVNGAFRHGGRVFHEIELKAILRDERFIDVAADKSN
ncbi:MAG: twitching motility protein PilI [Limisphaerales bacterium]|jgi:twitching motility protein PilI